MRTRWASSPSGWICTGCELQRRHVLLRLQEQPGSDLSVNAVAQVDPRNAPAKNKGAEVRGRKYAPTESLRLGLGAAYVDAIVEGYIDARGTGVPGNYIPSNAPRWSGQCDGALHLACIQRSICRPQDGRRLP